MYQTTIMKNRLYLAKFIFNILHLFQPFDNDLVTAVHVSVKRHMWYMSEELVPLALCDHGTSNAEKKAIVAHMLQAGRPQQIVPQKPNMQTRVLDGMIRGEVELHQFVGQRSWLLFDLLDIPVNWMRHDPQNWLLSEAFRRFQDMITSLEVVNDCAERSIKDVTQYINYSKDPNRRDQVMMVVNHHRQLYDFKNLTKQQMDNMDDFI